MSEDPKVVILTRYVGPIGALDWYRERLTLGMGIRCRGLPDLEVLHYPD